MARTTPPDRLIDSGGFRLIYPNTKSLQPLQVLVGGIAGFGAILVILNLISPPKSLIGSRSFGMGTVMFLVGGLAFLYVLLWRANARLLIGAGQVGYQNAFGFRRIWLRGQIDRAVDMIVTYTKSAQPLRGIYLFGPDGKRVMVFNTRAWNPDDLREFVEASGVLLDYRDQPLPIAEARKEFPHAFGWGSQHVMLGTGIVMTLAVVLAIGGSLLWSALSHG